MDGMNSDGGPEQVRNRNFASKADGTSPDLHHASGADDTAADMHQADEAEAAVADTHYAREADGTVAEMHAHEAEVTAVEVHPKRTGMYRIWLRSNERDDDAIVVIHEDTLVSMRLLKGRRLSAAEWRQLRHEEALEEAYRAALAIIERKARTSRELADALKRKGYEPDAIDGCIRRLQSRKLLDDSAYARRFAEQRTMGGRKGSRLIRQELVQRGISKAEADQALGELDDSLEIEAARALARKKWPQMKGDRRERTMKLTAYLLRRGFPGGVVRTAMEQQRAEWQQEPEAETWRAIDVEGEAEDWNGEEDPGSAPAEEWP